MDNPTDVSHEEYKANKEFEKFLWGHSVWMRRILLATAALAVYAALTNWTIRFLFGDAGRFWFLAMLFVALAFVYHCTLYMLLFKKMMGGSVNKVFRILVYIAVPSSFYLLPPILVELALAYFFWPLVLLTSFHFFLLTVLVLILGEARCIRNRDIKGAILFFFAFLIPAIISVGYLRKDEKEYLEERKKFKEKLK